MTTPQANANPDLEPSDPEAGNIAASCSADNGKLNTKNASSSGNSYSQILKSSSIIGGAQGINYLIAMVRTKIVAVLLGPSGVGLVGLYISATGLVAIFSGFGIGSSGVREIAEAHSSDDPEKIACTLMTLRRACWVSGFFGWVLTVALSYPLSVWTFNSPDYAAAIALLGVTILLGSISSGQSALIQGMRRIGDLARLNVIGAIAGTIVSVSLYWWLGEKGIISVLITTAAINLGFTWWYARKIKIMPASQSFSQTLQNSKRLISLGLAFMWSGLLTAAVTLAIRAMIIRDFGLDANGIYQAAWGISGMFAGFILAAMGTDFYPRLTAVVDDHPAMVRLVNEQTEIGILLAIPGLVGTLTFAPWLMRLFYSEKFIVGSDLLPWFILGVFGRVISWPIGFIMLALGAGKWFAITETISLIFQIGTTMVLMRAVGLWGSALAFLLLYIFYTAAVYLVSVRLIHFKWSRSVVKLLIETTILVTIAFLARRVFPESVAVGIGVVLTIASGLYSLRGLALRIGAENRLVCIVMRTPWIRHFLDI